MFEGEFPAYWRYAELQHWLEQAARTHPRLLRLETIGHSHEGRPILVAIITNFDSATDIDKPALWIDANLHSAELVGSVVAVHLIGRLLQDYGHDGDITRCLDTRAFYICPRVNPDGAEWALADTPRLVRSSTRRWPMQGTVPAGLQVQDIDSDGRILSMRIRDANGPWKIDPEEPRLLIARDPAESGGDYFRLLPEGLFNEYDGINMPAEQRAENLDLNRNFPVQWRGEHEQPGAGPYPASEPEVRALLDFISRHENICTTISLHSYSGLLLRPISFRADDEMPAEDRWVFEALGKKGTALTGYPAISAYDGFRFHPQEVITGAMDDWAYLQTGRLAWTVELWAPCKQAGIDDARYVEWYRDHPIEDDRKLLAWSDRQLAGKGYIDWYPYEHPQLGAIELGGWDSLYSFWNPPTEMLENEIAPLADWLIWHNLVSPKLEWHSTRVTQLGDELWQIDAVVQNTGWLATDITRHARDKHMLTGIVLAIQCPPTVELVQGASRIDAGQLEGRSHKTATPTVWAGCPSDPTSERFRMQWLIRGHGAVTVTATHPRAGRLETKLSLK